MRAGRKAIAVESVASARTDFLDHTAAELEQLIAERERHLTYLRADLAIVRARQKVAN